MPVVGSTTFALGVVAAIALASCVAVIAVLWQASNALADVDALGSLPPQLAGLEPALDDINRSLARIPDATVAARH